MLDAPYTMRAPRSRGGRATAGRGCPTVAHTTTSHRPSSIAAAARHDHPDRGGAAEVDALGEVHRPAAVLGDGRGNEQRRLGDVAARTPGRRPPTTRCRRRPARRPPAPAHCSSVSVGVPVNLRSAGRSAIPTMHASPRRPVTTADRSAYACPADEPDSPARARAVWGDGRPRPPQAAPVVTGSTLRRQRLRRRSRHVAPDPPSVTASCRSRASSTRSHPSSGAPAHLPSRSPGRRARRQEAPVWAGLFQSHQAAHPACADVPVTVDAEAVPRRSSRTSVIPRSPAASSPYCARQESSSVRHAPSVPPIAARARTGAHLPVRSSPALRGRGSVSYDERCCACANTIAVSLRESAENSAQPAFRCALVRAVGAIGPRPPHVRSRRLVEGVAVLLRQAPRRRHVPRQGEPAVRAARRGSSTRISSRRTSGSSTTRCSATTRCSSAPRTSNDSGAGPRRCSPTRRRCTRTARARGDRTPGSTSSRRSTGGSRSSARGARLTRRLTRGSDAHAPAECARRRRRGPPTCAADGWCARPQVRPATIRPSCGRASRPGRRAPAGEPIGLRRVDPGEHAALAARGHRHLPVDQEGEAAEHPLLGDAALARQQLPDPVGELLVVRHASDGTRSQAAGSPPVYAASVRVAAPVASSVGVPDAMSAAHHDALLLVMNCRPASELVHSPTAAASTGSPVARCSDSPTSPRSQPIPTAPGPNSSQWSSTGAVCASSRRVRSGPSAVIRTSIQLMPAAELPRGAEPRRRFALLDDAARVALELVAPAESEVAGRPGRNQRGMRSALVHASHTSSTSDA